MNLIDRLIACESQGGVMLLGLDDFSCINLLNGHAFGNTVLRMFAQSPNASSPKERPCSASMATCSLS